MIETTTQAGLEYIMNGQAFGNTASALLASGGDPRAMRPYKEVPGGPDFITVNENGKEVHKLVGNSAATLLKDEWELIDEIVIKVAKARLRAFGDLRDAGLQFIIPEGMGKTVLQYQAMSDISRATMAMEPRVQSQGDRPVFDLINLPLPILMKDFTFGIRELMASRNRGPGLDVSTAEAAAHRVAELADDLLIGNVSPYSYNGGTIYGYTTFPQRMTKVMTNPTAPGWTASTTLGEVLAMKLQSQQAFHYGPWVLYTSVAWDEFLDDDYSAAKGDRTLRERLQVIQGIADVRTLDTLTGYQMILVEMRARNVRAVVGMDIVAVQYNSPGDFETNIKIMAILVPQLRSDHNGNTGIVHGNAP